MNLHPGGGGGTYARYQNSNIPRKHWFQAKKGPLLKTKRWLFPVKKHPFFYRNTDIGWTGTCILTFDFTILCLFSGSSSGSRLGSPESLRESLSVRAAYISWIVRGFWPPYFVPGYKKVPFFYKSRTCRGLRKDPLFPRNTSRGCGPPLYPTAPPPPPPTGRVYTTSGVLDSPLSIWCLMYAIIVNVRATWLPCDVYW